MAGQNRIENITPVLGVASLSRSRDFFIAQLDFSLDWQGTSVGSVTRDGKAIMLSEFEAKGATVWIGVNDIQPIYESLKAAGVEIFQEPTNQPWAYEFRAKDPDGNILWFGSGPLPE